MPRYYFIPIEGDIPDGAEGATIRAHFTDDAADDVEGHAPAILQTDAAPPANRMATFRLIPTSDEGGRKGFHLEPVSDASLTSHVLLVDSGEAGKLVGRFAPADDAEGHIHGR
jgi:hypothetical protein